MLKFEILALVVPQGTLFGPAFVFSPPVNGDFVLGISSYAVEERQPGVFLQEMLQSVFQTRRIQYP